MYTKRMLLFVTLLASLLLLVACGGGSSSPAVESVDTGAQDAQTAAAGEQPVSTGSGQYNESPMLAERVAAGELPPLEERLPAEPLVVEPLNEIGQYGGQIQVGARGSDLYGADASMVGAELQLMGRITPDLQGVVPNLVKGWDISDDFTTYTIYMREGVRWSDGEPLTADDFMFWYEDVLLNPDLTPVIAVYFNPGGETMQVTKLDDYSFEIKFAVPNPTFLMTSIGHRYGFSSGWGHFIPEHYMKQFHIKYNEEAQALAEAEGFDFWYQNFLQKYNRNQNKDRPVNDAYIVREETPDAVFFERNPYFWMVDSAGNQLPYIDEIAMSRIGDLELYNAKITSGEVDFAGFDTSVLNYALYDDASAQGNYRIKLWKSGKGSEVVYQVNMTYGDPVLREIFQDVRFRRALSLAINRDEINDVIYFGQATPGQMTVTPLSVLYKDEYRTAWADYDPEQANALLDEMGLEWNDDHTVRLRPDGEPMIINWDMYESETPKGPITELVKEYWEDIGIQINVKSVTRQLLGPKVLANEEPMFLWHGDSATDILFPIDRRWFVGRYGDDANQAVLWSQWFDTRGAQGEEPPDYYKQLFEWYELYNKTLDPQYGHAMLESQAENIWTIGTVGMAPHPLIVRNNLCNVADEGIWTWDDLWSWPFRPEQWYLSQTGPCP